MAASMSMIEQIAKRVFDVVIATSALVVLSPLLAMVAIAVKLDSRGPVLFRQNAARLQ
jgi:polysaccharide biosynthesis protein PslA